MSNSNGYNRNSLFALEQSLFGDNAVYPALQFSDEESEESKDYQNQGTEAQAFDWDEAIALEYEEDTTPESESMSEQNSEELEEEDNAKSMSWENYDSTSQGFDWEDDDAEAFEVEEEETEYPLSRSNSLFALEQSLFGVTSSYQPSLQFSLEEEEEPVSQPTESQAFDWDDAIALEYPETLYPTPMYLDSQPSDYPSQSFTLKDEPPTYNVEAFEVEEESEAAPTNKDYPNSAAYGFDADSSDDDVPPPSEESSDRHQAYGLDTNNTPEPTTQKSNSSEAIPVNATVAMPPSPPPKSAQPVEALSDHDFDEFERGTVRDRAADAEAFATDLAAILRGEKTYEPPAENPTPPPPAPQPQTQPAPQSQAQSIPPKKASPHDIFDQMGRNMAHATAFDLGTFSLEQRFDEFDRILDEQESTSLAYTEDGSESEDENTSTKAQSFDFDDEELAADVAAIGVDEPWQALQFGKSHSKGSVQQPKSSRQAPETTGAVVTPTKLIPGSDGTYPKQQYELDKFQLELYPYVKAPDNRFEDSVALKYGADFKVRFCRGGNQKNTVGIIQLICPQTKIFDHTVVRQWNVDKRAPDDNSITMAKCLYGNDQDKISSTYYQEQPKRYLSPMECWLIDTPKEFNGKFDKGSFTGETNTLFAQYVVELSNKDGIIFNQGIVWGYSVVQNAQDKTKYDVLMQAPCKSLLSNTKEHLQAISTFIGKTIDEIKSYIR